MKIVIILNMFGPEDVEVRGDLLNSFIIRKKAEENFEENLRQDIIEECEAKLGPVQRVTVYEVILKGACQDNNSISRIILKEQFRLNLKKMPLPKNALR